MKMKRCHRNTCIPCEAPDWGPVLRECRGFTFIAIFDIILIYLMGKSLTEVEIIKHIVNKHTNNMNLNTDEKKQTCKDMFKSICKVY